MLEYILILVVVVSLILGGIYQLNTAFKSWAENYFGNYLACLLETGELPSIGGAPGDSGVCNQLFKPFSLAEGRPLRTGANQQQESAEQGDGGGARERRAGASGQQGNYTVVRSGGGAFRAAGGGGVRRRGAGSAGAKTGSTDASDYGGGYSSNVGVQQAPVRKTLDTRFAWERDDQERATRKVANAPKRPGEEGQRLPSIRMKKSDLKKDGQIAPESEMTFPDFIRILIIAAIVILLLWYLGGQAMQIGKSMER